jgi:hypothetical protein
MAGSIERPVEPWHLRYWAGDHLPQAVLDFERIAAPIEPPVEDDMPKATFIRRTDQPKVYLAGLAVTPRHVSSFKAAEYHAKREGIEILPPPADASEDITDGDGTRRKVMVVNDGTLFGI